MSLEFCSFSSGSSGNCYLVRSETTSLLIDTGISGKRILENLDKMGISKDNLSGVLITHEHSDHVRSLRTVMKKNPNMQAYANTGTWKAITSLVSETQQSVFVTGETFYIGDIRVKSFPISHDAAEPVGYSFFSEDKQISFLTDTGCLTNEIFEEILEADLLILEANHDVEMLRVGRYPWFLKQRILGEKGHLSNAEAARTICRLLSEQGKFRHVLLAHLSKENNFPEMAYQTIKNILEDANYFIGRNVCVNVIARDELSALYTL